MKTPKSAAPSLAEMATFGDLLKQLRRRAKLTQGELAAQVGFSVAQISRLEQNERLPDVAIVQAQFIPALALQNDAPLAQRLLALATVAREEKTNPARQAIPEDLHAPAETDESEAGQALPAPLIGREQELAMISKRLLAAPGRLLTLVGPAGVGKTRLAWAIAAQLQDLFRDGMYFVSLATLNDPEQLIPLLSLHLGLTSNGSQTLRERLCKFLRRKELLIILDHFDQMTAAAPLVAAMLEQCPRLRLLITSRAPLQMRAEQRYKVQPLAPMEAVALFIQRAQAAKPDFVATPDDTAALTEVCWQFACLPLAIALAAPQIKRCPPAQLLEALSAHFPVLNDGSELDDLAFYDQLLSNTITWLYRRLSTSEQGQLARLSVFAGGFLVDAAHTVSGAKLATLQALVRQNLLTVETQANGELRFHLVEALRTFSATHLASSGEEEQVRQRHAETFLALAETAHLNCQDVAQKSWLDQLAREHENLRAAFHWLLQADRLAALRLASALSEFWLSRGDRAEGRQWLTQTLMATQAPASLRAQALLAAGQLAQQQGDDVAAQTLLEASLTLYRQLGDQAGCAEALYAGGWVAAHLQESERALDLFAESLKLLRTFEDKPKLAKRLLALGGSQRLPTMTYAQAIAYLDESLTLLRQGGQPNELETVFEARGNVALAFGQYATAITAFTEALTLARKHETKPAMIQALIGLGAAQRHQGESAAARQAYQEARQLAQQFADKEGALLALYHLGQAEADLGNGPGAASYFVQSLLLGMELENEPILARSLAGLGGIALARRQAERAARWLAAAQKVFAAQPACLTSTERARYDQTVVNARTALGEIKFKRAWAKGQTMSTEQAVEEALSAGL